MTLKILGIGTGRDGTLSLCQLIQNIYILNISHNVPVAMHETNGYDIYQGIQYFWSTQDSSPMITVMQNWSHQVEIGNGYAFFMPAILKAFGPELKIIRLRRNRNKCVQSLSKRPLLNPHNWGGYVSEQTKIALTRPTAVDFKEMSIDSWRALSLEEKISWYYDKTHELLDLYLPKFNHVLEVSTEQLSHPDTIQTITQFINPTFTNLPQPVHVHLSSPFDYTELNSEERQRLENLFREMDVQKLIKSDLYPLEFFLNKIIAKLGYTKEIDKNILNIFIALRQNLDQNIQLLQKTKY